MSESPEIKKSNQPSPLDDKLVEEAKKIIQSIAIPSPPRILMDIQQEMGKPEPEYRTLAELIAQDVSMTARVLKVANSPFFGLRYRAKSIDTALSVLGLDNFANVIMTAALRDAMKHQNVPLKELEAFYHHSILIARLCQRIAQKIFQKERDILFPHQAYLTGLFHDCGMPMLAWRFSDYYPSVRREFGDNRSLIEVEEALFKTNHCIVGRFLARAWRLPELVCDAIQFHHYPGIRWEEDADLRRMAALLMLAEHMASDAGLSHRDHPGIYDFSFSSDDGLGTLLSELALKREDMETLKCDFEEHMA